MKRRLAAGVTAFFIVLTLTFSITRAAETPYFTAVNNELLPFNKSAMPFFSSGVLYVPSTVFSELNIYSSSSPELGRVHLYKGSKYVDFYETENKSIDQDGNEREGVSARRHNGIFYLPLGVVCSYFDLQYSFISYEPISILWIKSTQAVNAKSIVSEKNFIGLYRDRMQRYANAYYASEADSPPDVSSSPGQEEIPAPTYEDVSVYLGFFNVSAGSTLDILNALAAPGYRACFFVSAADVIENSGLIRRIAGSGHSIGIRLLTGEYDEYIETSRLLFEAAKVRTVLISSGGGTADTARIVAEENSLVYWEAGHEYNIESQFSSETAGKRLPTDPGSQYGMAFECSENTSAVLPGILSILRRNYYSVVKLTETAAPT